MTKELKNDLTKVKSNKKVNSANSKPRAKKQTSASKQSAPKNAANKKPVSKQANKKAAPKQAPKKQSRKSQTNINKKPRTKKGSKVKITFLGGVGEIGKNMTAIEYENDMILIDAGLTFPGDDMPGIDLVVPDITYIKENRDKLKAIVLTHGHEDHIGGLPFLLNDVNVPIYGSALTLGLVDNKLREHPKIKHKAIVVKPKNVLRIGPFTIEFIHVNHSIAGAMALAIDTPSGKIVHTGDFKIDFTPVDGRVTDLTRFGELGKKGVDLFLCESTNVGREGFSISETTVGKALAEVFEKNTKQRLFIATFASNIHRIQQVMDLAEKHKRKVVFTGRSMINVSETAMKLGELKFDKNNLIDIKKINKYAPHEILVLTTGSQGEAMAALTRMAKGMFKGVKLGEGDTVVFSSSPIPGNEKSVYRVMNALYKQDVNVIYDELAEVHASGHACRGEIKMLHSLVKPKMFMPVHGEYRHLKVHKELAMQMGVEERNIIMPDLGMQVEFGNGAIREVGMVKAGKRLIDGHGIGDMADAVLKDRKQLSEDGICVSVLNVSSMSGHLANDPFTITRGVIYNDEQEEFNQSAKQVLNKLLKDEDLRGVDLNEVRNKVRKELSNFIYKKTKRRPMILVIVMFD